MPNTAPKPTESSGPPAWKERMAVALARDIVDGERIISGAHTEISFAAAMLAQKMHAPNIKLQLGGTCFLVTLPVEKPVTPPAEEPAPAAGGQTSTTSSGVKARD